MDNEWESGAIMVNTFVSFKTFYNNFKFNFFQIFQIQMFLLSSEFNMKSKTK